MCCLFGMIDYKNHFNRQEKNKIISVLSAACEERGVDATGIAYNAHDKICIYKRPIEASKMKYRIPYGVTTIMGHTRMTTQGNEKFNYNNHPFYGKVNGIEFALAHNGVLRNDLHLRHKEKLPHTKIETDSYIAVQLIEKKKELSFDSQNLWLSNLRVPLLLRCWMARTTFTLSKEITPCVFTITRTLGYISTHRQRKFSVKR